MQIEHLRYLMAAAQYGSLNKAAKALYCTQPAITRAIKTVEKELGAPVFERTPTGIVPTQLGAKVLEDSRLIFGYIDNWRRSAEEAQSKSSISILFTGVSPRFITVNTIVNFQKPIQTCMSMHSTFRIPMHGLRWSRRSFPALSSPTKCRTIGIGEKVRRGARYAAGYSAAR